MDRAALTEGEAELLIDGLSDDVAFVWVLTHLGLRGNPPEDPGPPSPAAVRAAFESLGRLTDAGLVSTGRLEDVDGGPPSRVAPVRHIAEQLPAVRERVERAIQAGEGWEWSCWIANTPIGDTLARQALDERS